VKNTNIKSAHAVVSTHDATWGLLTPDRRCPVFARRRKAACPFLVYFYENEQNRFVNIMHAGNQKWRNFADFE